MDFKVIKKFIVTLAALFFSFCLMECNVSGKKIDFTYDKTGRLLKMSYEQTFSISYQYDNNGNLIKRIVQGGGGTQRFSMSINPQPANGVIKVPNNGSEINCGSTGNVCTHSYVANTEIILSAMADAGYSFNSWTGDCHICNSSTCKIIIDSNKYCSAKFLSKDSDGDGVDDSTEDNVAKGGDGNGDGIADSQQKNVTSLKDISGAWYITLENRKGYKQVNVKAVPVPQDAPKDIYFPFGMFEFKILGLNIQGETVELRLFVPLNKKIVGYWKKNHQNGLWKNIAKNIIHGPQYAPNKTVITFELKDGGTFDEDGLVNGEILDQGGPGVLTGAVTVPLFTPMGITIFVILTIITAAVFSAFKKKKVYEVIAEIS